MTVGERIQKYANEKGMTLKQVATEADISYSTLYAIVKRKSDGVRSDIIESVASALKIPPSALYWDNLATSMTELQSRYEKLGYDTTGRKTDEAGRPITRLSLKCTLETSDESFNFVKDYLELDGNSQVDIEKIVAAYISMGDIGRKKMVEYAQDLAKIQEYQNK